MKNAFSCLLAIVWPVLNTFCQPAARPLTVGDAVPDYLIRNLVNYKTPTARLSDFKEKLLILDFMATSCGSCMYNLPHLDSLQAAYPDKLQLLPVSYEPKATLLSMLHNRSAGKKIHSPFVAQDTVLKSWFPHQYVSHMVWIYKGIVKAITKPEYVKAANIEKILYNQPVRLPVKSDIGRYDPAAPLLSANPEAVTPANQPALRYYSVLPGYMDGFASTTTQYTDSVQSVDRLTLINRSILHLYQYALGLSPDFPASCIVLTVKDSSRFFFNRKGYKSDWYQTSYRCYQLTLPMGTPDAVKKEKMLADLNFYLGLHGRVVQQSVTCLVLQRDSSLTPVSEKPVGEIIQVSGIATQVNRLFGSLPCYDEVPGSRSLYVPRPPDFTDTTAISRLLLPYGIRLVPASPGTL